jgi:hypothetical protein
MAEPQGMQNLVTRAPREEVKALKEWARMYGRTLEEELRIAYRLHLHGHAIGHLREANRGENRSKVEQELARATTRFDELTHSAYSRPSPGEAALASVREVATSN